VELYTQKRAGKLVSPLADRYAAKFRYGCWVPVTCPAGSSLSQR